MEKTYFKCAVDELKVNLEFYFYRVRRLLSIF